MTFCTEQIGSSNTTCSWGVTA